VGTAAVKHFLVSHFSGRPAGDARGHLADDGSLDLKFEGGALFALRPAAGARPQPGAAGRSGHLRPRQGSRPAVPFPAARSQRPHFIPKPIPRQTAGNQHHRKLVSELPREAAVSGEALPALSRAGLELAAFCFEPADNTITRSWRAFLRRFKIAYRRCCGRPFHPQDRAFPNRPTSAVSTHYPTSARTGPCAHRAHRLPPAPQAARS